MDKKLLALGYSAIKSGSALATDVRDAVLTLIGDALDIASPTAPTAPIFALPPRGAKPKVALCLGHGRATDEGNVGAGGISEEDYNLTVLRQVGSRLRALGHDVVEITYYQGNGYEAAMIWLAKELKRQGVTAAIEFHFNASDAGTATGHEVLHWAESTVGVTLARSILTALDAEFREHPSRGLKPRTSKDRGALFLSLTHCPAAIVEPFFGDNKKDWALCGSDAGTVRVVNAYVQGISSWVESRVAA